jgi:hypothetical protein
MSVEVCEASRAIWRRELAVGALWQLQGPLRWLPQVHGEEEDEYDFMGVLHRMISDKRWDLDRFLQVSDQYLELIGLPKSETISVVLRRSIDALRSGESPPGYAFGDLQALSKQNHERLS